MTTYCQDQHTRREKAVQGSLTVFAQCVAQAKRKAFDGVLATLAGLAVTAGFYAVNADGLWQLPAAITVLAVLYSSHNFLLCAFAYDAHRRSTSEIEAGGFTVEQSAQSTPPDYQVRVMLEPTIQSTAYLWDDFYSADQIDADEALSFAWTPSGLLGAVGLAEKPQGRFALDSYKMALARRIDRLVAQEDEMAARQLLRQAWRIESTVATDDLAKVGQAFVTESEWLDDRSRFPPDGLPEGSIEHDPELLVFLREDDCLEAFLNEVYAGFEDQETD